MDPRVEKLKTTAECETFVANARARGREDLAREACLRSVQLLASAHAANSPVEQECLEAVYAREVALAAKQGRKSSASRVQTSIRANGVLAAVDRLASNPDEADYAALLELGLEKYAAEEVVTRHPKEFSFEAVERSKARVSRRGNPPA